MDTSAVNLVGVKHIRELLAYCRNGEKNGAEG